MKLFYYLLYKEKFICWHRSSGIHMRFVHVKTITFYLFFCVSKTLLNIVVEPISYFFVIHLISNHVLVFCCRRTYNSTGINPNFGWNHRSWFGTEKIVTYGVFAWNQMLGVRIWVRATHMKAIATVLHDIRKLIALWFIE